jgi:hypothetical protein
LRRFPFGATIRLALAHSERELLPETAKHEIAVDDELGRPPAGGPSWITPVVLFTGLFLTLILSKIGVHFFFLPIILPFGLGGGRLFRHFFPPPRRVLRLQDGLLWLAGEGAWKTSTLGRLDVSRGAFVTLGTTGFWADGFEDAHLRVVAAAGALTVPAHGGEHARKLRRELTDLLEADGVPLLEGDASLQGDVWTEPFDTGEQIEWASARGRGLFGARTATALRVTHDAWALRVRSGNRVLVSTGGPGLLEARLVSAEHGGPLGASVVQDAKMLELFSENESVARVGLELSEPELRWVAERIQETSRLRH